MKTAGAVAVAVAVAVVGMAAVAAVAAVAEAVAAATKSAHRSADVCQAHAERVPGLTCVVCAHCGAISVAVRVVLFDVGPMPPRAACPVGLDRSLTTDG